MKNKRSTIKDVAQKAGVSISTVSLAINNRPYVSIEVRERIQAVIKELNFHPHRNARGLASKTSGNIGFILSEEHFSQAEPFYTKIFLGTEIEARRLRYYILLTTVAPSRTDSEEIPRFLLEQNVDGVIVAGKIHPSWIDEIQGRHLPIVLIDFETPRYDLSSVMIDNRSGIHKAMGYLSQCGHQRIAFIGGDLKHPSINARYAAYKECVASFDLEAPESYVSIEQEDSGIENGFAAAKDVMLSSDVKPTAIIAANDAMAIGAMRYLQSAGYIVPDDVSVVGFDNIEASEQTSPRLTTLQVPKEEMGAIAVNRLVELMHADEKVTVKSLVGVELIVRESSKKINHEVPANIET
jgi:LacI family transcriptional regulator